MRKIIPVLFVLACSRYLSGQPLDAPRFEVGPVFGATTFGPAISSHDMRAAFGGRAVLNLHRRIAVEYQMAYFRSPVSTSATQGSGHLKWKIWEEKSGILNIFTVLGPGFMREEDELIGGTYHDVYKYTSIAIDFGAGIEVVPHRRFSVRLDLTDFYAGTKFAGTSPRFWDHNLDFKAAIMCRF